MGVGIHEVRITNITVTPFVLHPKFVLHSEAEDLLSVVTGALHAGADQEGVQSDERAHRLDHLTRSSV